MPAQMNLEEEPMAFRKTERVIPLPSSAIGFYKLVTERRSFRPWRSSSPMSAELSYGAVASLWTSADGQGSPSLRPHIRLFYPP